MKYKAVNRLSEEQFRRLTGVKCTTFDKMTEILKEAMRPRKEEEVEIISFVSKTCC